LPIASGGGPREAAQLQQQAATAGTTAGKPAQLAAAAAGDAAGAGPSGGNEAGEAVVRNGGSYRMQAGSHIQVHTAQHA